MNSKFKKFYNLRRERAGKKYNMPNGENQSVYRNSAIDVAEEVADAAAIAELWAEKIKKLPPSVDRNLWIQDIDVIMLQLESIFNAVLFLYKSMPEDVNTDFITVKRPVLITKEGEII